MRILSTITKAYYGRPGAIEPMYLEFTLPLRRMGHEVAHFDHVKTGREFGHDICGERFVEQVRHGGYDVVFYQTGGRDAMNRDAIREASKYAPIVAWNSDDDWQWDSYTSKIAPLFTHAITTYRHIYEANRKAHPNLLLSQWGCLQDYANAAKPKDLRFSFAGQIYTSRVKDCLHLRKRCDLKVFGLGSIRIKCPLLASRPAYRLVARHLPALNQPLEGYRAINDIWNRSKISYTPMGASVDPARLQIKGRAFQMGLSGTLMLTQMSPGLEEFYEPDEEFVPYDSIEDCAAKARFYLTNERERVRIAAAYEKRTRAEHLWEHRFQKIFNQIGLAQASLRRTA